MNQDANPERTIGHVGNGRRPVPHGGDLRPRNAAAGVPCGGRRSGLRGTIIPEKPSYDLLIFSLNILTAADILDFTVPTGIPSVSAISAYFIS